MVGSKICNYTPADTHNPNPLETEAGEWFWVSGLSGYTNESLSQKKKKVENKKEAEEMEQGGGEKRVERHIGEWRGEGKQEFS